MSNNRLYALLAYAGTLPFVACALLAIGGVPSISGFGGWADIAAGYGLAIASFMAGVHWGIYLHRSPHTPLNLLATSNGITVAVWLAFVLTPTMVSIAVTGCAFLLLLLVDSKLASAGLLTKTYLTLRRNVTCVVIAMLALTIVFA